LIALIRKIVSLALLAFVANATWHLFVLYSAHYKFRDSVRYAAQNRGDKTDDQLHDYLMEVAEEADLPIASDALVVRHEGMSTTVFVTYTRPLDLLPNGSYPWTFSFQVDTYTLQAPNTVGLPKK
jgi:hypothetical protein